VSSILEQTFRDFEVLIMDDCSPDNTQEVARSFQDERVKHFRNEPNLGHLKNYNKGISLAKGEYIWLISADDSLRSPGVLERYVRLMESNAKIGYVYCPTVKVVNGENRGVMTYSEVAAQDTVINGHRFLIEHLLHTNIVPAPAAMARRKCYEQISVFPLDLPHTGDWFLWALFALYFDVGYFAEPMVNRRFHEGNMSGTYYREATLALFANSLAVPLRIQERAATEKFDEVVAGCKRGVVDEYLRQTIPHKPGDVVQATLTDKEFEESLRRHIASEMYRTWIRSRVFAGLGDYFYEQGDVPRGLDYYSRALRESGQMPKVWAKYLLLRMGRTGTLLRESMSAVKRSVRKNPSARNLI
jgi:glycosyltransferase involved in cell wall biosynthesis